MPCCYACLRLRGFAELRLMAMLRDADADAAHANISPLADAARCFMRHYSLRCYARYYFSFRQRRDASLCFDILLPP